LLTPELEFWTLPKNLMLKKEEKKKCLNKILIERKILLG